MRVRVCASVRGAKHRARVRRLTSGDTAGPRRAGDLRLLSRGAIAGMTAVAMGLVPASVSAASARLPHAVASAPPRHVAAAPDTAFTSAGLTRSLKPALAGSHGSTITCSLKINHPHRSSHNIAAVNVVATWTCKPRAVAQLSMTVKLFTFAGVEQGSDSFKNKNKAKLTGHADSPCIPDWYYGTADGKVVFPSGYSPHSGTLHVQSATVFVLCL